MKHVAQKGKNKGNLVNCRAKSTDACPLKNADGTPAPHFNNQTEYEDYLANNNDNFAEVKKEDGIISNNENSEFPSGFDEVEIEALMEKFSKLTPEQQTANAKVSRNPKELFALVKSPLMPASVRRAVASNWDAPSEALDLLYKINDQFTDRLIASHPNASNEALTYFAESGRDQAKTEVARNPITPKHLLVKLIKEDPDGLRIRIISERDDLDVELLTKLAKEWKNRMQAGKILADNTVDNIVNNPKINDEILRILESSGDETTQQYVANSKVCPKGVLKKLSTSKWPGVRQIVAKNTNTDPKVLDKLAFDKHWLVKSEARRNSMLPMKTLLKIAEEAAGEE